MHKPIPTRSIEADLLARFLLARADGRLVTYAELAGVIGEEIRRGRGYGRLATARRMLLAEHRILFQTIPGKGLKRSDSAEAIDSGKAALGQVHRAAQRGLKRIAAADIATLTNEQKLEFNATASHLGAIRAVTTARASARLSAAVAETMERLPLTKTLDVFRLAGPAWKKSKMEGPEQTHLPFTQQRGAG